HYYFGKFNTAKSGTITVNVPHIDTSLKITAGTLRDKLQPGQEEIWELTVSGEGKDKFLAEMLATMYDASLDQFKSNSINFPMGTKTNYSSFRWNTYQSFGTNSFYQLIQNPYQYYYPNIYLAFDELNWFGFGWSETYFNYYQGEVTLIGGIKVKESQELGANTAVMDMEMAPVTSVDGILNGRVVGLNYSSNSGNSNIITIRGVGSIDGTANPLYVIDGVIVEGSNPLTNIDPNTIINVRVLKEDR